MSLGLVAYSGFALIEHRLLRARGRAGGLALLLSTVNCLTAVQRQGLWIAGIVIEKTRNAQKQI